jgi:hypothetical protein
MRAAPSVGCGGGASTFCWRSSRSPSSPFFFSWCGSDLQASSRDAVVDALVPALVLPEGKVLAVTAVFAYAMATGQVEEEPFVPYARGGPMLDMFLLKPVEASGGHWCLRGFSTSDEVTRTRYSLRAGPVVQITLPRRDTIKDTAYDWLWIVRKDELDVPGLVKLNDGNWREGGRQRPGRRSFQERTGRSEDVICHGLHTETVSPRTSRSRDS